MLREIAPSHLSPLAKNTNKSLFTQTFLFLLSRVSAGVLPEGNQRGTQPARRLLSAPPRRLRRPRFHARVQPIERAAGSVGAEAGPGRVYFRSLGRISRWNTQLLGRFPLKPDT